MTLEAPDVSLRLKIAGSDAAEAVIDAITKVVVEDEITLPDLAVVHLDDPDGTLLRSTGADVGEELEIEISAAGESNRIFKGEITAVESTIDNEHRRAVIRGYDKTHRMQRGRVTETHEDSTIGDVISKVARRQGLRASDNGDASWVNEHVVQWNESDWEFLMRLAGDHGHELVVDDSALEFRKPVEAKDGPSEGSRNRVAALQLVLGENLLRIRAGVTAGDATEKVEVRGWDPATKKEVVSSATVGNAATHDSGVNVSRIASDVGAELTVRVDLPFESTEPAQAVADGIAEQIAATVAECEGVTFGDAQMRAGTIVNLSGLGSPFDGKHTLTSCRHVVAGRLYTTEFRSSGRQRRGLLGLTGAGPRRSSNSVQGVVPAIVTDLADPEEKGRVRVKYPWLGDKAVSPWARIMHPGAGKERGFVMLPEVDDEVLVGFHHGNTQMPYILGGLYNGKDTPPPELLDNNTVAKRVMVSREKHRLELNDKENVVLLSTGDDKLKIEMTQSDTKITISSAGEVEITSQQDLTIKAQGKMNMEATGEMSLKGMGVKIDAGGAAFEAKGLSAKVEGSTSAEMTGVNAKVAGSAMAEITGAMVKIN